jgi:hypothetical protein
VTAAEALELIRGYASANRITITRHAAQRMRQRGATRAHVKSALENAARCYASVDGLDRWCVTGPDADGDELACVVVIEDGDLVITVR